MNTGHPAMHAGEAVAEAIKEEGVGAVYSVPGSHIHPIYDGLSRIEGLKFVTVKQEPNLSSEIAGASPRTLARLFERDLGMSFNQWRQRIRFHNALEALSCGEPISRVAEQHGYRSASAFSAAFRKVMGTPPSRVSAERKLLGEEQTQPNDTQRDC